MPKSTQEDEWIISTPANPKGVSKTAAGPMNVVRKLEEQEDDWGVEDT